MSTIFEPIIYREWPAEVIAEAVTEFNHQMHDGAGIPEISAGLHGLDFLTRRSTIGPDLMARIEGCALEAEMRIELLGMQEAEQRTYDERIKLAVVAVRNLQKQAEMILRRARLAGSNYMSARYETFIDEEDDDSTPGSTK